MNSIRTILKVSFLLLLVSSMGWFFWTLRQPKKNYDAVFSSLTRLVNNQTINGQDREMVFAFLSHKFTPEHGFPLEAGYKTTINKIQDGAQLDDSDKRLLVEMIEISKKGVSPHH